MTKRKLVLASLVLALGIAGASTAQATGISTGAGAFSPVGENLVGVRFCPITILCRKGTHAKCHYNTHRHKCVCRCVPNHPY
jgi:hypothetical protein